ncbi:hypothetical protein [Budvicia aquatica]|nr:hypothetical protein [Budvicia aquatica]PHI30041.1 hypothetical protein CRN84_12165 [Budvicia aquatica]
MTTPGSNNIEKSVVIRDSDIRRLKFYVEYMKSLLSNNKNLDVDCTSINEKLATEYPSIIERKSFVDNMKKECNRFILPKKEFNWIKVNDRVCFWVWLMIRDIRNKYLPIRNDLLDLAHPAFYDVLVINKVPASTKERYDAIIELFDGLRTDIGFIRYYFYQLKIEIQHVYKFSTSFNWLKKENKKQCQWALEYIKGSGVINQYESMLTPMSKKEIHSTVIAAFDSWHALDAVKELFLIKIKKAWGQKKYRDEISDKKLLNTYISKNAKDKLDMMTSTNKKKIHEMIEMMIDNEYKKYQ